MEKLRILQIIPASGWVARFLNDDKSMMESPLVCWALVDDMSGDRYVMGMDVVDGSVEFCEDVDCFLEYWREERSEE